MRAKRAEGGRLTFYCPGCHTRHVVTIRGGCQGTAWDWNQSLERPTLSPSVLVTWYKPSDDDADFDDPTKDVKMTCHSFVRDGYIEFLTDCTHSLAGQTVQLPEL